MATKGLSYVSINVKPEEEGPRAYVGHLTFQKNFWLKSPPWGPKIWSNLIKYPPPRQWIKLNNYLIDFQCLIPWQKASPYHQQFTQSHKVRRSIN